LQDRAIRHREARRLDVSIDGGGRSQLKPLSRSDVSDDCSANDDRVGEEVGFHRGALIDSERVVAEIAFCSDSHSREYPTVWHVDYSVRRRRLMRPRGAGLRISLLPTFPIATS
jgi:hypothetical protein